MDSRERLLRVLEILKKHFPEGGLVFRYKDPFKIFVSAFLSSRTRDETTKEVCERLFQKVKSFEGILKLKEQELASLIYPVGFYRQKARNLKKIAEIITRKYGGKIPCSKEALMELPGVGLKIATLVLQRICGAPEICVDTHVHRIMNRLGIVSTKTPEETYRELMKVVPPELRADINRLFVPFGKTICLPKNPRCSTCPIATLCPQGKDKKHREK